MEQKIILHAEDELGHARLLQRVIKKSEFNIQYHLVPNGEEALNYLFHRVPYQDVALYPDPHLILLDIRMPRVSGLEVLKEIKEDLKLRMIPTIILSTSQTKENIREASKYHANSYLLKQFDIEEFNQMIQDTLLYWLRWHETGEEY